MKRNSKIARRGAGALALALASIALAACGTQTIDHEDLQDQLTEQLSADAGVDPSGVSVECPEGVEVEQGREFECMLTAPNGDEVVVEVTLTNDEGGFEAIVPPQQF